MNNFTQDNVNSIRKRIEYEDQLLNSRTSIVLTLNGLMAVAASMQIPDLARLAVAIIIVIVNILWIICANDAKGYIKVLTLNIKDSEFIPIDEKIRHGYQSTKFRIGTTNFMSIIFPVLLLVGWVTAIIVSLIIKYCTCI